jgi:hypothetical protein
MALCGVILLHGLSAKVIEVLFSLEKMAVLAFATFNALVDIRFVCVL